MFFTQILGFKGRGSWMTSDGGSSGHLFPAKMRKNPATILANPRTNPAAQKQNSPKSPFCPKPARTKSLRSPFFLSKGCENISTRVPLLGNEQNMWKQDMWKLTAFVETFVGTSVDTLVGRFVGTFVGTPCRAKTGKWTFVGALVGTLVGALVGVFVGPLVGTLVGPLVGSNFAVRVLCACLGKSKWFLDAMEILWGALSWFGALCAIPFVRIHSRARKPWSANRELRGWQKRGCRDRCQERPEKGA